MDNLKIDILKHLKKVGADSQKINIADFLNSKINKDCDFFHINSLMTNFLRDKIIDGYANVNKTYTNGKADFTFKSYPIRLTPNGEAVLKAFVNSKEESLLKKYGLAINVFSVMVAIFFGSLSVYYNSQNQKLRDSVFQKDIQIIKLRDSLNVLIRNERQSQNQSPHKK